MDTRIVNFLISNQKLNTNQVNILLTPLVDRYNHIITHGGQRYYSGWGRSSEKGDLVSMITNIIRNQNVKSDKILDLVSSYSNKELNKQWIFSKYTLEKLLNNTKDMSDDKAIKLMNYIKDSNSIVGYTNKMGQILKNDMIWNRYKVGYIKSIFNKVIKIRIRGFFNIRGDLKSQLDNAFKYFKVEDYMDIKEIDNSGTVNMFNAEHNILTETSIANMGYNWREQERIKNGDAKKFRDFVIKLVGRKIVSLLNDREELIKYLNSI